MNNPVSEVVTPRGQDEQCQAAGRQRPSVVAIHDVECFFIFGNTFRTLSRLM